MKVKDQFVCAISIYVILFHINIRLNMESDEPKGVVHTSLSLSLSFQFFTLALDSQSNSLQSFKMRIKKNRM